MLFGLLALKLHIFRCHCCFKKYIAGARVANKMETHLTNPAVGIKRLRLLTVTHLDNEKGKKKFHQPAMVKKSGLSKYLAEVFCIFEK